MSSKYIVRQPIKDQANKIIGYEIQYHGENQAFGDNGKNVRENDFAAADTIYNFLTMNTCLLYTSPSPRDRSVSRMPSSA